MAAHIIIADCRCCCLQNNGSQNIIKGQGFLHIAIKHKMAINAQFLNYDTYQIYEDNLDKKMG